MSGSAVRQRPHVVLPVVAAVLLGACASGGASRSAAASLPDESTEASEAPTRVVVNNQSWERVTVYISQGTTSWRLGDVEAGSKRIMPLGNFGRTLIGGAAFFVARPLAGTPFRSESFLVSPRGGTPTWTIENHTAASFVTVR